MREIKFRAWDEKEKEMQNVRDIYFNKETGEIESFITRGKKSTYATDVHTHKLMQYTGLKDKNGVEIYEGDIYRYKYYFDSEKYEYRHFVVEWDRTDIAYEGSFHGYEFDESYIEIVGNIYENPEPLETKKSS